METTDESDGRSPKVVIVGAGYAGVAAAGVLRAGGITDVTVLEAQGRPGGRVQTLQLEDGHLEIGAQFLHGQNEIYAIAERENNLLDDEEGEEAEILPDTVLQYHEYDFYTPGGHLVDGHVVLENLRALEELNNKARSEGVASDVMVSLGDFFRDRYTDVMSTTPGEDWVKGSMLKWFESWAKMDSGGTVDEQSLPGTGKYAYVPGSGVQETKTGMEEVFKCLLRESLPPENLLLNKPVKKIHWTEKAVDSAESETVDENSSKRERTKELYKEVDENWSKPERTKESGLELDKDSSDDERTKVFAGTNFISGETKPSAGDQADAAVTGLSIHMEKSGATIDENDADDSGMESSASKTTPETSDDEKTEDFKERTDGVVKIPPEQIILEISDDKLRTNPPASKKLGDGFRVRAECEDGEIFHADHVIMTSSIGFLKDNEDFFQPPLPSLHRRAVNSMGFGNVAKVFLIWDQEESTGLQSVLPCMDDVMAEWQRQVLGSDVWGAVFLWPDGKKPQLKSAVTPITTSTGRQWFEDVSLWELPSSLDTCISAWIGGEAATVMEAVPESEVKDVLYEMLVLFLNKPSIPPPTRVIRSTWHSNPYTRGAYSFLATGAPLELHDALSQPLPAKEDPVLQLAGEACSKHYYSTAHGALDSGSLAARAILRHYGKPAHE